MLNSKLQAIILKRASFGEADKILTVFSREQGKLSLVAKGIRKIKSRRAPHLELFNRAHLLVHKNIITSAQSLSRSKFSSDLASLGFAFYAVEIIDKLLPEGQPHEKVYDLLSGLFDSSQLSENDVKDFTSKVLWELGYFPFGKYPKEGITVFVEHIAERGIRSKKIIDML